MPALDTADKKARILVADDDRFYRQVFSDLIEGLGHECMTVDNGLAVMEKVDSFKPDIIIMDVVMPGMGGFDVTRRLKSEHTTMHIPVLIVTSLSDRESKLKGLQDGADELLSKPVDETEFRIRIRNLLKVKKYEDYLIAHGRMLEGEVNNKQEQLEKAYEKIRYGYIETVYRLTLAAEYRDKETGGHIKRISLYSQMLARYLGLDETTAEAIFFASPMHDVGKIGIPDSILLKKGGHTEAEAVIMRSHTTIGADILRESDSEILQAAHDIALTHHESWNGAGYPRGLKGEEIPISGRIVNIVDIYDAIRSRRPYKDAFDHESAVRIIKGSEGKFDPRVFKGFLDCAEQFKRLFDEHQQD
ncbi:MAG: HD domain-containing phosphohydrolase [Thermodesulfobacteriota bacterium]